MSQNGICNWALGIQIFVLKRRYHSKKSGTYEAPPFKEKVGLSKLQPGLGQRHDLYPPAAGTRKISFVDVIDLIGFAHVNQINNVVTTVNHLSSKL